MVEEEEPQHKVTEINLISHKIDVAVSQKFIPGKPGCLTAGTRFKYFHGVTHCVLSDKDAKYRQNSAIIIPEPIYILDLNLTMPWMAKRQELKRNGG